MWKALSGAKVHGRSGPGVQAPAFRPTFYVGLNVQLLGLNVQNFKYLFSGQWR
jgi:hypothetical protein